MLLVQKEHERRRLEFEERVKENKTIFSESDSDSESKPKKKRKRGISSSDDSDGKIHPNFSPHFNFEIRFRIKCFPTLENISRFILTRSRTRFS